MDSDKEVEAFYDAVTQGRPLDALARQYGLQRKVRWPYTHQMETDDELRQRINLAKADQRR